MEEIRGTRIQKDTVITGEGVELQVTAANPGIRIISALIDIVFLVLGFVLSANVVSSNIPMIDNAAHTAAYIIVLTVWTLIVPVTVETLTRGRSLGKFVTGLRVVRDDGGSVYFRHVIVRGIVGLFEVWGTIGSLALITSFTNRRGKRIGDMLAGTYVISQGFRPDREALVMPPEMAIWAKTAEVAPLPGDLSIAIRQFLTDCSSMLPQPRAQLGLSLANEAERFVSPPPPWGTHPERFLAALMVVRRDLEYATYLRRNQNLTRRIERLQQKRAECNHLQVYGS